MTETLNSVCEFIVDCLHAAAPVVESGFPLIRTPNIGKGRLDHNGVYRVTDEVYEKWTHLFHDICYHNQSKKGKMESFGELI